MKTKVLLPLWGALALGLAGCDWLFPPETSAPPLPPPPGHIVRIEYPDTTGFHNDVRPHASIVGARWVDTPVCAPGQLHDPCDARFAHSLPPLILEMLNDGNAAITRVLGRVEVYDRQEARVATLNWFEKTFKAKGERINAWEPRETVELVLMVAAQCADPALPMCDPENYRPENVSRVYLDLQGVEIVPNRERP